MPLQEVIVCASVPPSQGGSGAITIHDIQTGSSLASFKQTNASTHCMDVINTRARQGGLLLAAQPDKSILNVYNFQKDQIALKIVLPERMSCLAVDREGLYCAGGTAAGRIYFWEIASGILYNSWEAHYRQVSVLRFTPDGSALLSGSEDSAVSVWSVSRLLQDEVQTEIPEAYANLSDHTLPITDITCGFGPFPSCRALTASVDHSVKLWDLSSKSLLTSFTFPHAISCVAWDVTERMFFAASSEGSIHQVNLFKSRIDKTGGRVIEAVGGAGVSDIIRIGDEDPKEARKRLISVGEPITTLTISLTSSLLLAGTETGLVNIYDVPSHQLLRSISSHAGTRITHLVTLLKPPDLVGHVQLSLRAGGEGDLGIPVRPIVPFQRLRETKVRDAHEVSMMLPAQPKATPESLTLYSPEELLQDYGLFVQPAGDQEAAPAEALQSRVSELEDEVRRLREHLGRAKGVNDVMWETMVQKLLAQGTAKGDGDEVDADANGRTRKKGKTRS
ncbi:WD40 repeat-like protein [Auriscalpium vulgare]|uniref:WD40 repeat-like protein n=1 Tax=Auriscalpium vulgare TaxID=40419 RepID=A0ACB8RQD1_9AGAM|nr:WD40 repeat-like protein [Auriscalpium vulgare]